MNTNKQELNPKEEIAVVMTREEFDTILQSTAFAYSFIACIVADKQAVGEAILNTFSSYLTHKYPRPDECIEICKKLAEKIGNKTMIELKVSQAEKIVENLEEKDTDNGRLPN